MFVNVINCIIINCIIDLCILSESGLCVSLSELSRITFTVFRIFNKTRTLLRLERTMNLLEGGKGGEGRGREGKGGEGRGREGKGGEGRGREGKGGEGRVGERGC